MQIVLSPLFINLTIPFTLMKFFLSLIPVCLFAVSVCTAQDAEYSFKEIYKVSTPAQLSISSSDGNIEVLPSQGNSIEVFFQVKKGNNVLKISKAELSKELKLEIETTSNSVAIKVEYPPSTWTFGFNDRMQVNFRVLVPTQTACDLRSSDGNIGLSGVSGNQKCKTSDGDIRVSSIKGDAFGRTSDGNIHVAQVNGAVDMKTSDGNIRLENIAGNATASTSDGNITITKAKGEISTSTSDGDISFREIAGSFSGSTSDGNVKGDMIELQKSLTVRTSDGNIDISIPDHLGLDLDVKGESLHVPLTNFSGTSDEKVIRGKSNGGGIAVNLSSNGGVSLTYR
jgi:DUF4097 and DUF4098 domain-containing protein YvlB